MATTFAPGGDERLEDPQVVRRLLAHGVEVARLPGRHAAALQALHAGHLQLVAVQHLERVAPDLGLVVLHVAGREQHGLARPARPGGYGRSARAQLLESGGREIGQQLVLVDPERRLQKPAVQAHPVHHVRHAEAQPRQRAGRVGVGEQAVAQRDPALPRALRLVAVDELREVELELVLLARRVRALHLAQLALEARVHHAVGLAGGDLRDVAVVLAVDQVEQHREAVAVLEAHAAAVAQLEGPRDLLRERRLVPVLRLVGIVGEPVRRLVRDRLVVRGRHGVARAARGRRLPRCRGRARGSGPPAARRDAS